MTITVSASAPGISPTFGPTPRIRTRSTSPTPACSVRTTAARHSNASMRPTATTPACGSIPTIPIASSTAMTAATISIDGGKNWSTQGNQPTAQFYHVTADNDFPYRVYGTQQDNSSVGIATASDRGYIDRADWDAVGG